MTITVPTKLGPIGFKSPQLEVRGPMTHEQAGERSAQKVPATNRAIETGIQARLMSGLLTGTIYCVQTIAGFNYAEIHGKA
jgi:hypothetical protein